MGAGGEVEEVEERLTRVGIYLIFHVSDYFAVWFLLTKGIEPGIVAFVAILIVTADGTVEDTFSHTLLIGDVVEKMFTFLRELYAIAHERRADVEFIVPARVLFRLVDVQFHLQAFVEGRLFFSFESAEDGTIAFSDGHDVADVILRFAVESACLGLIAVRDGKYETLFETDDGFWHSYVVLCFASYSR